MTSDRFLASSGPDRCSADSSSSSTPATFLPPVSVSLTCGPGRRRVCGWNWPGATLSTEMDRPEWISSQEASEKVLEVLFGQGLGTEAIS